MTGGKSSLSLHMHTSPYSSTAEQQHSKLGMPCSSRYEADYSNPTQ